MSDSVAKFFRIEGETLDMETLGNRKFSVFMKALCNEAGGVQYGFIDDLFKTLDVEIEGIAGLAKNWMSGRNQGYKEYFKGKNFNQKHYDSFLRYLNNKINKRFVIIQDTLEIYNYEYTYIDFETDKQGIFFKSILNQFKDIVGLPLDPNTVPLIRSENTNNEQGKISQNETPSVQMRKIFEEAVKNYNIAGYICKLTDYLYGEDFYATDIFGFIKTMQVDLLTKYVNNQDEDIFEKISLLNVALNTYCGCFEMLQSSISEVYGLMWLMTARYDDIFDLINKDRTETKKALLEEKNKIVPLADADVKINSLLELESKINQLNFLESIFLSHKEIITLFEELCDGKTLLIY